MKNRRHIMNQKSDKMAKKQAPARLQLTNPDKILYPAVGISKLDLLNYYYQIEKWILPYILKRPLTVVRCPEGQQEKCFYQRHFNQIDVENVYSIMLQDKTAKPAPYIYIKDKLGLMALIQLSVLEIHPWGSRIDHIEKPDLITFDLDPGVDVEWKKVIEVAYIVKESLEQMRLLSFVKTTGSKGLHVVVPIKRQYSWDQVKVFAHTLAAHLALRHPALIVANMNKSKRKGKIFIDYLRNQRGASSIAAYSTRIRENASVATPLAWEELSIRIKSDTFTVKNLPRRLVRLKQDPWSDFLNLKQKLRLPVI
ncbi:MAG: putative ATP-dependent ligase YkoU [Pseudomonadota bacterium]